MLIPAAHLRSFFGVRANGVLHVGAHLAEEFHDYHSNGFGKVLWVEGQEGLISTIEAQVSSSTDEVYHGIVWSESGVQLTFNISNNSQSSSLYKPAKHLEEYPGVNFLQHRPVTTTRLDELIPESEMFDFVNLDVQGAELEALKGLGSRLDPVNWVYCELNLVELYGGIPLLLDLDSFLLSKGLRRVVAVWGAHHWGEGLYVRQSEVRNIGWLIFSGKIYRALWKAGLWVGVKSLKKRIRKTVDFIYLRWRSLQKRV